MTERTVPHRTTDATAAHGGTADEYEVRPDLPVYECEYCGRPFASEERRVLHLGLDHPGELDEDEVAAFRAAHADEEADLRLFRLKALGTLLILYFGFLMIYAVV